MSDSSASPPDGYVWLVLLKDEEDYFYLEIPVDIVMLLCLRPLKYLLFLGWCILGVEGVLALEDDGDEIPTDTDLNDRGTYYFVAAADTDLTHVVDLKVIKIRMNVPSESTWTHDEFRDKLLERDICCVWTGLGASGGDGVHIIPHVRGSEWFQLIIANRPNYQENVTDLDDINDIRNGMFASATMHRYFDRRHIAVLKTPNQILSTRDIPERHQRTLPGGVSYPSHVRYTLQWLNPDEFAQPGLPNNSDATFKSRTRKPKPSDLLLHYNYGAAAVRSWGRGVKLLENLGNPPRPPIPVPAPVGPAVTIHDRTIAIQKREAARAAGGAGSGGATAGAGTGQPVESEGQVTWDEDDVMLFFWGNSRAAKERHLKKVDENTRRMEQWREAVPRASV